jgi:hypothetical protein
MKTYFYVARVGNHTQHLDVQESDKGIADTQAKIEVERWLKRHGYTSADLDQFDYSHSTP